MLISKNDTARTVYLPSVAVEALKALRKGKVVSTMAVFLLSDGAPLAKSALMQRWKSIRKDAGLSDFRWHDLRHSCATFRAQKGATLLEIGSVLGHKSPSVTQRYSNLVQGAPVKGHTELDAKLRGSS